MQPPSAPNPYLKTKIMTASPEELRLMLYDVFRANYGGRKHRCEVCNLDSFHVWTLQRGPEDEDERYEDQEHEEITACEQCLTDAILDGANPR